jgi:glycosyltransferase involved in cell wall biosynthesis
LPATLPGGEPWPRITIVTPSFNQGHFLEETLRSVLLQGYPNLEYFVIDGGSRDQSVDIIRRYEPWLSGWVSEKDRGQSHAINKGFERATGDLITFQNSDDIYLPEALSDAALRWAARRDAGIVVGGFHYIDGRTMRPDPVPARLPGPGPIDLFLADPEVWRMHQVSVLYARHALDQVGRHVREDLNWTMDREILYRVCRRYPAILSERNYAAFRWHDSGKSISNYLRADMEYADLHENEPYEDPVLQRRAREVARMRRARGWLRYAKTCGSPGAGLKALWNGVRCRPGLLWQPQFRAAAWRLVFPGRHH